MTASQILEEKGYDNFDVNDIVQANENSLDDQVRDKFGVTEPVHLWAGYEIGDADEDELSKIALNNGFDDIDDLFAAMDKTLIELAESVPNKK